MSLRINSPAYVGDVNAFRLMAAIPCCSIVMLTLGLYYWLRIRIRCHYQSHTLNTDNFKAVLRSLTCCDVMLRVFRRTRMELKRSPWMLSYVCKSVSNMSWRLRTWLRLPTECSNLA